MPSETLETRNEQKARFIGQSEARKALLKQNGRSDKDIAKDPQIKRFKAKIKQINGALARIAFLEEQTQKLREKKEQRLAEEAAQRAASIAGEIKKEKKKAEEKAPEPKKKGGAKAPAKGKQEAPKKKGK
jgi:hypothetical protein